MYYETKHFYLFVLNYEKEWTVITYFATKQAWESNINPTELELGAKHTLTIHNHRLKKKAVNEYVTNKDLWS